MASSSFNTLAVEPSRLLLAACILAANILWVSVVLPPNPGAESRRRGEVKDRLHIGVLSLTGTHYAFWALHAAAAILHAVLICTYPSPPATICPQPSFAELSDPGLFTWNAKLAAMLVIIAAGSAVRIAAFRNLGANFTFNLKPPSGLVTTGVHRYIQHPSYAGLLPVILCILYLYIRLDGMAACYLPGDWVQQWMRILHPAFAAIVAVILSTAVPTRIMDEERMLKEAFGKEWEEYHRTTKRLIPGIF